MSPRRRRNYDEEKHETVIVESIRHKDKRVNIPTEELRDFMADEEARPTIMLYPRDPSLDPQLVWKGKDEQDQHPLAVPVVPIYIQEKIHPQAIVEGLRAEARREKNAQLTLFEDFNGLEFDRLVDFYKHEQNWTNRMILGDSLLVMTSLAEKEGLKGKVQMIYFDPPYGIKFGSNWQVSTRRREVRDGKVEDVTREPEQIRAFRDTWELGIHSYLTYLRDRFIVARELLTESGSIFVQIGDENVHLVRALLDEVFGSENYCALILFQKTTWVTSNLLPTLFDYILWYAKDKKQVKYRQLYRPLSEEETRKDYRYVALGGLCGPKRMMTAEELAGKTILPEGSVKFASDNLTSPGYSAGTSVEFVYQGRTFHPGPNLHWKTTVDGLRRLARAGRLFAAKNSLRQVRTPYDFPVRALTNIWTDTTSGSFMEDKVYVVQTNPKVIERCMLMTTDPGDLVLDPTCGSGTTAYVAEQWGRRWIVIDTSRVALAIARTRLMTARFPYYILADSPEGILKEAEITGRTPPAVMPKTEGDIRRGFVYRRVPHITLKSIADNAEIDDIYTRWQEKWEPIRLELNGLLGKTLEDWQIPLEPEDWWPDRAKELLVEWWRLRRKCQEEIDASIARNADYEVLYDQPYEDPKRIRVTGPFTVESLSPHRVLAPDQERPETEIAAAKQVFSDQFEATIIEHLRKAGVQNTRRNQRLKFERLEPYAGTWIHAAGEYMEGDRLKRVAVCIGPQYGTVGPELVKEAAKEAVQGLGFDLLLVCGFAFDPHVSEEVKRYGKLTVLPVRMNADLLIGELKNTGSGNLFMVFGEPDIEITQRHDGKLVVSLKGVDIYDPNTGEIRSSSPDEIACWFIDTDYNGESFFVRHAYFTGADDPYEKLRRALRAEISEEAWASLYSTQSRPFEPPKTGKIAVKVINHYGDEVLKVYDVRNYCRASGEVS